jgi:hypothetical protein
MRRVNVHVLVLVLVNVDVPDTESMRQTDNSPGKLHILFEQYLER